MFRALRLDMMDCVGVAANLNYRLDNPAVRRVRLAHANVAVDSPVAALDRMYPAIACHCAGAYLGVFAQCLVGALGVALCPQRQEEAGHERRLEPRRVASASSGG